VTDDGSPDPALLAALEAWRSAPGPGTTAQVLAALTTARVFAGITATSTAEHVEQGTGLRAESSAEMALVTLVAGDERALPVFTSTAALRRWRLDARPVPVPGDAVCLAALEQGATTLLVDLDHAVTGDALRDLARGYVPVVGSGPRLASRRTTEELGAVDAGEGAGVDDGLRAALRDALREEPVVAARLLSGPHGPVLGVVPSRPLAPQEQAALAGRVAARLGSALPAQGLDLAVVPADGPGEPLALGRRPRRWRRG
jgi:hypothetical protein